MVITRENVSAIETDPACSVHDACFTGFRYDHETRELHFRCRDFSCTGWFCFRFQNVYAFELSAGDWWGGGDLRILDWTVIKDNRMICRLWQENAAKLASAAVSPPAALRPADVFRLADPNFAVETRFLFSDGNTLTIACGQIEFSSPKA